LAATYDLMIAGAGPVGCVIAERAASLLGWRVLVVERRDHVAGLCYDCLHDSGVLIHRYGPHYFRTNSQRVIDHLSRFTGWIDADYVVRSEVRGKLHPFPINLTTLETFFGRPFDEASARRMIDSVREDCPAPRNSEEYVLSRVGREMYEAFYLPYTLKQWEQHPRDLHPSVCGRVPIRFDRDERYGDESFQRMPKDGYTAMYAAMLEHPGIDVRLRSEFADVAREIPPAKATVWCGPIDEYFDHRLGTLPWRSLHFEFEYFDRPRVQPCVQINYPGEHAYTRSVEIKHVTKQEHPGTVVAYDYPRSTGDPYYPVPAPQNDRLYAAYAELAEKETRERNVYFCGRLARYTYINSDRAVEMALDSFDRIRADALRGR
jgi:UDP-galactopyranose mutase